MAWATFWATFSQSHLVTLVASDNLSWRAVRVTRLAEFSPNEIPLTLGYIFCGKLQK
jgi:hypothetical protein